MNWACCGPCGISLWVKKLMESIDERGGANQLCWFVGRPTTQPIQPSTPITIKQSIQSKTFDWLSLICELVCWLSWLGCCCRPILPFHQFSVIPPFPFRNSSNWFHSKIIYVFIPVISSTHSLRSVGLGPGGGERWLVGWLRNEMELPRHASFIEEISFLQITE